MKPLLPSNHILLSAITTRPARYKFQRSQLARNVILFSLLTPFACIAMAQTFGPVASLWPSTETIKAMLTSTQLAPDGQIAPSAPRPSPQILFVAANNNGGVTSSDGDDTGQQTSETIFVPNNGPEVTIIGGNKTIADTDKVVGELVNFTGTATDSGGTITNTQWLIGGTVVAAGTSASIVLNDGTTVVSFKATDNSGASTTRSVTYTVLAPTFSLPRIRSLSSLQLTSDSEFSIATRDPNNFLVVIAPATQTLAITGYIFPQNADKNFTADIFVVAVTPAGSFMRNLDGAFVPWNGRITDVQPAYENRQLTDQVSVNIFAGKLAVPGTYRLYMGYMRADRSELIYTANAAVVDILP